MASAPSELADGSARSRWAISAILAAVLVLGWIVVRAYRDPSLPFLAPHGQAAWVVPRIDMPLRSFTEPLPPTEFVVRFRVAALGPRPVLRLRALEHHELLVDGRAAGAQRSGDWKQAREYPLEGLREGDHELLVRVANPRGTPALWFESDGIEPRLASGPHVLVRGPEGSAPARPADERAVEDESLGLPRPVDAWKRHGARMAVLACAMLALVLAFARLPARVRERLARPRVWVAVVVVAAIALYLDHLARVQGGFDSLEHLKYVQAVAGGRIPHVREGYQTYQPPLYYVLSGASLAMLERFGGNAWLVAVTWLGGLSRALQVLAAAALARLLFPGRRDAWILAGLFAACVPVNLYMSAFISNEPFGAALSGLGLLFAVRALVDPARSLALSGVFFGLSLLTKITCALYLPLVGIAYLWSAHARRLPWAVRVRSLALFYVVVVAVAGFGLFRAWTQVGTPLPGNWDGKVGFYWWQYPGYVTPRYYLDFGTALDRPYYAGFVSFWDGLYSTFWGDGLTGGVWPKQALEVVRWNWDHVAIGYWLALPLTLMLVLGAVLGVRALFRSEQAGAWALVTGSAAVTLVAIAYMTLRVPSYAQVKAHYGLAALAGIASLFALAVTWIADRGAAWRVAAWSVVLLFAANSWIAFWAT